jgi:hypothetical protein
MHAARTHTHPPTPSPSSQAKSKKLMWRMNKGFVRDLLPQEPLATQIDPWWIVHVVNLGEGAPIGGRVCVGLTVRF